MDGIELLCPPREHQLNTVRVHVRYHSSTGGEIIHKNYTAESQQLAAPAKCPRTEKGKHLETTHSIHV